jgi:hypothetical protein
MRSPLPHQGRTGVTLEVEPAPRFIAVCGVPPSHVPQPRNLHGFGAILENCIASTSVLKEVAPCSFLPRRVEECAISSYKEPTVDALAPGADEGRGWLRKATGSCLPSFDPWISEWALEVSHVGQKSTLFLLGVLSGFTGQHQF